MSDEVCPECGRNHDQDWQSTPEIDRDVAALVALVLGDEHPAAEDATVKEFAIIVGDMTRAPGLLLRAIQIIASQAVLLASIVQLEDDEDDPLAQARKTMRDVLMYYAAEEGKDTDE